MNKKIISWGIFILLCFIWGSSFILMKVIREGLTAPQTAALRIFSASIVFVPFAFAHIKKIPREKRLLSCVTGAFGNLIPAFCFAYGIMKIDSSLAGILNSLTPICVVVIGVSFFKDHFVWKKIIGVLIGFAGLCLLTYNHATLTINNIEYALLIIAGTISYGANINIVGHKLREVNPVHLSTVSLSAMCLPALLMLWHQDFFDLDFSDTTIQWAVINAVVLGLSASTIGTFLFYSLVKREGGLFASLVTYGVPFVALFWGVLAGELITVVEVACLLIILAGVYLANRK
ncbi:DMT family transporter [Terrimonas rubra]|uniref:DMT family transporter n=1 Tax=Terrimonas rubra TaxID=1035890 RepID=A0ABW6A7K1_9BACT